MKQATQTFSSVAQWVVAFVILIGVWTAVAPRVSKLILVEPSLVWGQIQTWASNGFLWTMVGFTAQEAVGGYTIGAAVGIMLALLVGLLPSIFGKVVEPIVVAVYAAPKFVLIPLFFVWLGSGLYPRILLIALSVFALLFVNTVTGIRTVDPDRAQMLQMLGATRGQLARKLLLPHTMGYIATGLTTAAPFAVSIAVGSEILFGSTSGLGGVMNTQSQLYNTKGVLGALAVATVLSALAIILSDRGFGRLTRPGGRFARV